ELAGLADGLGGKLAGFVEAGGDRGDLALRELAGRRLDHLLLFAECEVHEITGCRRCGTMPGSGEGIIISDEPHGPPTDLPGMTFSGVLLRWRARAIRPFQPIARRAYGHQSGRQDAERRFRRHDGLRSGRDVDGRAVQGQAGRAGVGAGRVHADLLDESPARLRAARRRDQGKGVDTIACMAVNDVFVMDAWGKDRNVNGKVLMLADGNGEYTRALGLEMDGTKFGL